ncbi:MAG: hypothetical protein HQK49_07375 [Oligoflexia bacterium]|nr:hypothetical protein [Oligoflexia bacterium]
MEKSFLIFMSNNFKYVIKIILLLLLYSSTYLGNAYARNDWCIDENNLPCGFRTKAEALANGKCSTNSKRDENRSYKGGYVQNTVFVEKTNFLFTPIPTNTNKPFIGIRATICGNASVLDNAEVSGNARVYERAIVVSNNRPAATTLTLDAVEVDKVDKVNKKYMNRERTAFDKSFHDELAKKVKELEVDEKRKEGEIYSQVINLSNKKENFGIIFEDAIMMEKIMKIEDLLADLKGNHNYTGDSLELRKKLTHLLASINVYKKYFEIAEDKLAIDPDGLATEIEEINYSELLKKLLAELRLDEKGKDKLLRDFFDKLTKVNGNGKSILTNLDYLDPADSTNNNDCNHKRSDIAKFFNEITGINNFIADHAGVGAHADAYRSRPQSFKDEINYKLLVIASKNFDPEQLKTVAKSFMHGGAHCSDAKINEINVIYKTLCEKESMKDREYSYPKKDLHAQAYVMANNLKKIILDEEITKAIPEIEKREGRKLSEGNSYYNGTWDKLAKDGLGVAPQNSPYSFVLSNIAEIKKNILENKYTPQKLIKEYSNEISRRINEDYISVLNPYMKSSQLIRAFAKAELIRFGLLKVNDEK